MQFIYLGRTRHIAHNTGQFPVLIPGIEKLHCRISPALIVDKVLSGAVSVHYRLQPFLRSKLRPAVKCHSRIIMSAANPSRRPSLPGSYYQIFDSLHKKILAGHAAKHIFRKIKFRKNRRIIDLLIFRPHKIFIKRRGIVSVSHIEGNSLKKNPFCRQRFAKSPKSVHGNLRHIHRYKNCLLLSIIKRQCRSCERIVYILRAPHIHLPLHQRRLHRRNIRLRPAYFNCFSFHHFYLHSSSVSVRLYTPSRSISNRKALRP